MDAYCLYQAVSSGLNVAEVGVPKNEHLMLAKSAGNIDFKTTQRQHIVAWCNEEGYHIQ